MSKTFKSIIQKAKLDNPSMHFTEKVMQEVNAYEQVSINMSLKNLLLETPLEQPGKNFTTNIMSHIQLKTEKKAEPIVPKKMWWIAASWLFVLVVLAILPGESMSPSKITLDLLGGLGHTIGGFFSTIAEIPASYLTTIFSASIILLFEHLLGRKFLTNK